MKKDNEIIKLDVEMLEPFNNDELLVIRGGKSIAQILKDIFGNSGCTNNCDCTNPQCQ